MCGGMTSGKVNRASTMHESENEELEINAGGDFDLLKLHKVCMYEIIDTWCSEDGI